MTELWKTEEALWLEGADAFERIMADDCLMVFAPMGIMRNAEIVESLRHAPRWQSVSMSDRAEARPAPGVLSLAYRASAQRPDSAPYEALCTSTYFETADGWRLLQHQQTPL